MSKNTPNEILVEIKNLIFYSLTNPEVKNSNFEEMHRGIIKKYFDARDININYKAQTIDLQLPMFNTKYTHITFECMDLNSFLQSCVKPDEESLYFYQKLLAHYDIMSAA